MQHRTRQLLKLRLRATGLRSLRESKRFSCAARQSVNADAGASPLQGKPGLADGASSSEAPGQPGRPVTCAIF